MNIVEFIQASPANYTATSANAHNNLVYFSRLGAQASAHLFVDKDGVIRQSVCFEDTAWAVGNFAANQRGISIEVCSAARSVYPAVFGPHQENCELCYKQEIARRIKRCNAFALSSLDKLLKALTGHRSNQPKVHEQVVNLGVGKIQILIVDIAFDGILVCRVCRIIR